MLICLLSPLRFNSCLRHNSCLRRVGFEMGFATPTKCLYPEIRPLFLQLPGNIDITCLLQNKQDFGLRITKGIEYPLIWKSLEELNILWSLKSIHWTVSHMYLWKGYLSWLLFGIRILFWIYLLLSLTCISFMSRCGSVTWDMYVLRT